MREQILQALADATHSRKRHIGLRRLATLLAEGLGAEMCLIYASPPRRDGRSAWRFSNLTAAALGALDAHLNPSLIREVFAGGRPYLHNGLDYSVSDRRRSLVGRVRSVYCHPLAVASRTVAVVQLVNSKGSSGFGSRVARQLQELELTLAALLQLTLALGRAERRSYTDDLTRVHNPRYLRIALAREMKHCVRAGQPVSVIFADVDGFKEINRLHGHAVGSEVLCELARLLVRLVRPADIVTRYGGDEFVVVLPNSPPRTAQAIARRLQSRVAGYRFGRGQTAIQLSLSLGVASSPSHILSDRGLIEMADRAMYRDKTEIKKQTPAVG